MQSVQAMQQVPGFVDFEPALKNFPDFYQQCKRQIDALKLACGSDDVAIYIGGIDVYKLMTKIYNPLIDAPLFYIVQSNMDASILVGKAIAIEASINPGYVIVGSANALSSGDFKIDVRTGKVFLPFPDIKPKGDLPKPVFIDSREFIIDDIIKTPSLPTLIQQADESASSNQSANKSSIIRSLSYVLSCYFYWLRSGKVLSLDAASCVLDLCRRDTKKFDQLLAALQMCTQPPAGYTFDQLLHYIAGAAQYVVSISNRASAPLVNDNAALKAQIESLTKALESASARAEQLKKSNDDLHLENLLGSGTNQLNVILNSEKQTLAHTNVDLMNQNEHLFQETIKLEEDLKTAHEELIKMDNALKEEVELSEKLYKKGSAVEVKYNKVKEHIQELAAKLSERPKISTADYQATIDEKDAMIEALKKQVSEQQSGISTLSTKNHKLTQANTALSHELEETKSHTQKPSRPPEPLAPALAGVAVTITNTKAPKKAVIMEPPKAKPEKEKQVITAPVPAVLTSTQLKYALAQYILNVLTAPDDKLLPFFSTNPAIVPQNNLSENTSLAQAFALLPEGGFTLQQASDTASAFRKTCLQMLAWPNVEDISIRAGALLQDLDAEIDVTNCRKHLLLSAEERLNDAAAFVSIFIEFLKIVNNPSPLYKNAIALNTFLTDIDASAINARKLLTERLDRISNTHHLFFKHKEIIFEAQHAYNINIISPLPNQALLHKAGSLTGKRLEFAKTVASYPCTDEELKLAQGRFRRSIKATDAPDEAFTLEMFVYTFRTIINHYRLTLSTPLFTKFLSKSKTTAADAKESFLDILNILKVTEALAGPAKLVETYFDLCKLWSTHGSAKKVQSGHPLLRAISPLLDEKFLSTKATDKAIADQIAKATLDIKALFPTIHDDEVDCVFLIITSNFRNGLTGPSSKHEASILTKVEDRITLKKNPAGSSYLLSELLCIHLAEYLGRLAEQTGKHLELPTFSSNLKKLEKFSASPMHFGSMSSGVYLNMVGSVREVETVQEADEAMTFAAIVFEAFARISTFEMAKQEQEISNLILHLDTQCSTTPLGDGLTEEMRYLGWIALFTESYNFITQWNAYRKEAKSTTLDVVEKSLAHAVLLYRGKMADDIKLLLFRSGNLFKCLFKHRDTILKAQHQVNENNREAESQFIVEYYNTIKTQQISALYIEKAHYYFIQALKSDMTLDKLDNYIQKLSYQFVETVGSNMVIPAATVDPEITIDMLNRNLIMAMIDVVQMLNENPDLEFNPMFCVVNKSVSAKLATYNDDGLAALNALSEKHILLNQDNLTYAEFMSLSVVNNIFMLQSFGKMRKEDKALLPISLMQNLFLFGLNLQLNNAVDPHTIPAAKRFNDARELLRKINLFLHDPLLNNFCDVQSLQAISATIASEEKDNEGLLYNKDSFKELFTMHVRVSACYDFLMSNRNMLLSARRDHVTKSGFKLPHLQCYALYEKINAASNFREIAERNFVLFMGNRKTPITSEEFASLKNGLAIGQDLTQDLLSMSGMTKNLLQFAENFKVKMDSLPPPPAPPSKAKK